MKTRLLPLLFFLPLFFSCRPEKKETETAEQKPEGPPLLTSETAPAELTKYGTVNPETTAVISTKYGDIKVRLYQDTPLHRANFVRLAKYGFFNEGEFYRIVPGFMIQGGDGESREMKIGGYRIPAEFRPQYIHKRGALAMARYGDDKNPEKASSSHNFYLVQGTVYARPELLAIAREQGWNLTPEQIETYTTIGGVPSLDGEYTVFGEVLEGLHVIDSIAAVKTDQQNWPNEPVYHKVKVLE